MTLCQLVRYVEGKRGSPFMVLAPSDPDGKRGCGRPVVISARVEEQLVRAIDREKKLIEQRVIETDRQYGDKCTDANALRSFMRRKYQRRLELEGIEPAEAVRRVDEFAATPAFDKRLRSHKIRLSRARRRLRR